MLDFWWQMFYICTINQTGTLMIENKIATMPEHIKQRIAELSRQKIILEDQIEHTNSFTKRSMLEQDLYDVIHSITLLTHPYVDRTNV